MTYFKNVHTLEELRKQYKELLKQYHPDNGGSTEATQAINAEYTELFKVLKDKHDSKQTDEQEHKSSYDNMKYDFAEDEKLREMLGKIILFSGITIEIIGAWIWLSGNTYAIRKDLKELGFKFAGNKKMWYWHSEAFQKKSRKHLSINDIRNYYGSTSVEPDERKLLEA